METNTNQKETKEKEIKFSLNIVDVVLIVMVLLSFFSTLLFFLQNQQLRLQLNPPKNFAECESYPGSYIKESNPNICVTKSGQNFSKENQENQNNNESEKPEQEQPNMEVPENWKEYANAELGFLIKYPSDWKDPEVSEVSTRKRVTINLKMTIELGSYFDAALNRDLTFNEFVEKNRPPARTVINYTLDSIKGKRFLYQQGEGLAETLIAVPHPKGGIFTISYKTFPSDTTTQKTYYQILSSFKFGTDEASSGETVCKIGGCNSEICQNTSEESLSSDCVYKEEYTCYKTTKCEKQEDGKCGWTQTDELKACLQEKTGSQ